MVSENKNPKETLFFFFFFGKTGGQVLRVVPMAKIYNFSVVAYYYWFNCTKETCVLFIMWHFISQLWFLLKAFIQCEILLQGLKQLSSHKLSSTGLQLYLLERTYTFLKVGLIFFLQNHSITYYQFLTQNAISSYFDVRSFPEYER